MEDEDTNVVVMRAHRATRKVRMLVIGAVVLFLGLLILWISSGPGGWEQRLRKHFGPLEETPGTTPATKERISCVTDPAASTAKVYVTLAQEGLLWLDDTAHGLLADKELELTPGTHTVRAEIKRTDMRQVLTVKAGEEFRLHFDRERKSIELECAQSPAP